MNKLLLLVLLMEEITQQQLVEKNQRHTRNNWYEKDSCRGCS
jgi:hypothetical protein